MENTIVKAAFKIRSSRAIEKRSKFLWLVFSKFNLTLFIITVVIFLRVNFLKTDLSFARVFFHLTG